jgi:uncharacterized protein (TIGR00369 family)
MTPEESLDLWNQQYAELQARMNAGRGAGLAAPADVAGMTGLQALNAMLTGELPYPHIADTMDFGLVEVAFGKAVFQGTPALKHYNPLGSVHGGWYATLLDSALGCAVHTTLPAGKGYTTVDLSISLVRAITEKVKRVRCEATIVHAGGTIATAQARITDDAGTLYAHGTTTCLILAARG